MEIKEVFISAAVVLIGIVGVLTWVNGLTGYYGTSMNDTLNNTLSHTQSLLNENLSVMGQTISNNTRPPEGAGDTNPVDTITRRSWSTITLVGDLLGIIPALISDAAGIMGVPDSYRDIATTIFLFTFGLTIAYILLLGVRRLTS